MINIPELKTIQAYKAHCFCGHSPIWQVDRIKKLRIDQDKRKVANTILNRFAHK